MSKFSNLTSNKHVIVEFEIIIGTLTVHHYVEKTTNHVPLAGGSTADDESKADLIVAVETGEVTYVAIAGSILIVMIAIASGIYVIKKKRQ